MQNQSNIAAGQADSLTPAMLEAGAEYLAALLIDGADPDQVLIGTFAAMLSAQRQSGSEAPQRPF